MWLPKFLPKRPVLCFIDDDNEERRRFQEAMDPFFWCVTADTYEACRQKLRDTNLQPSLWVLDLYFPLPGRPVNSDREKIEQKEEMLAKYADLEQMTRDFQGFLREIGQASDGGIENLQKCKRDYRAPAVMFTRKGTLDDAIKCIDAGAAEVLKKPMPSRLAGSQLEKENQLDQAMKHKDSVTYLERKFRKIIESNSFWNKHKAWLSFFCGVALTELVAKVFDYFAHLL